MKHRFLLLPLLLIALLSSCVQQKKLAYIRTVDASSADSINATFTAQREPRIVAGDALTILVSALDLEAVRAFNLPVAMPQTVGQRSVTTYASGSGTLQYYLVDKDGNIQFPVLGTVHLEGLTRSEATALLTEQISQSVKDPIVNIQFQNFTITVLGEVAKPGQYTVTGERITIFEALGKAGDMTVYGKRNNVLVSRERDGKMEFCRLNLNDQSVFASPFYYLQQNDVVYVEPNNVRAIQSQNLSLYLSTISTLGSLTTVIVSVVSFSKRDASSK